MPTQFRWLWGAYAASTAGTWLAFDALPLLAIIVLGAGPLEVSLLAAAGLTVGALVAVPVGPWVEQRRKRPVMIAMDLIRCAAMLSLPLAYAAGRLTLTQLVVVSVVVGAADITFTAASGAYLKGLVPREQLLVANGRFEATTWTATMLGPPLGGAAIGLLGPVTTVLAHGMSFVASAVCLGRIDSGEPEPVRTPHDGDLREGWRTIWRSPALRPLLLNTAAVNALIMAPAPVLAVLMLGDLGFAPWQYGLAFAVPCAGGLIGSRLAGPLVARYGPERVLLTAGALRACWGLGLALVRPGVVGLLIVMVTELGLITSVGVFNPVLATHRLEQTPDGTVVRALSAWSVTTKASIAGATGLWGLLAAVTSPRVAIAAAGLLLLATPLLLPRPEPLPLGRRAR